MFNGPLRQYFSLYRAVSQITELGIYCRYVYGKISAVPLNILGSLCTLKSGTKIKNDYFIRTVSRHSNEGNQVVLSQTECPNMGIYTATTFDRTIFRQVSQKNGETCFHLRFHTHSAKCRYLQQSNLVILQEDRKWKVLSQREGERKEK